MRFADPLHFDVWGSFFTLSRYLSEMLSDILSSKGDFAMKRAFFIVLMAVLILTACTLDNSVDVLDNSVGRISFDTSIARGITASIDYPSLLDKTWTLTATKLDGGQKIGEGQYDNIVLTDTIEPFSIGSWRFTITDSEGAITGSVDTTIKAGSNTIAITVHSTATKGTLLIENCTFLESKIGAKVNYVDCYVDDNRVNGTDWAVNASMTEDGDLYTLPTIALQLAEGIHTVRLYYGADNGGTSSETVSIRIVNGMTTHFSIGEKEGNLTVSVSFEILDVFV